MAWMPIIEIYYREDRPIQWGYSSASPQLKLEMQTQGMPAAAAAAHARGTMSDITKSGLTAVSQACSVSSSVALWAPPAIAR